MGNITSAGTGLDIGKDDIQAPVQAVLNRPLRAYRLRQALYIGRQTANVEASFKRHLAIDAALRPDRHHGIQSQGRQYPADRSRKGGFEFVRIDQAKHVVEGVVQRLLGFQ